MDHHDPIPDHHDAIDYSSIGSPSDRRFLASPFASFGRLHPQERGNVFKIVGMFAAVVAAWLVFAAILSIFPWWLIMLSVIGLSGYLGVRQWKVQQRQARIDAGYCGRCGYDLRGGTVNCPECGRDARLDEPVWRKLKREHAERTKMMEKMTRPTATKPVPVVPIAKQKFRPPPVDLAPIPVEGDE